MKELYRTIIKTILFPVSYLRGKMIYQRFIKTARRGEYLFVFNNAIGEVVFSCGYIPALLRQNKVTHSIAMVNVRLEGVVKCYPIFDEVVVLSNRDIRCLCVYLDDKNSERMRAYNSIWSSKQQRQRADNPLLYKKGENRLAKVYADYFNVDWKSNITHPIVKDIDDLTFELNHLTKGKTVVLNSKANTCKMCSDKFWINLAHKLADRGYLIVFNGEPDYDTEEFLKIRPELDEISAVVNFCGSCISIQCGLSDLLVESGCCVHVVFNENIGDTNYERHSSSGGPYTIPKMYINRGNEEDKIIEDILLNYDYL